MIPLDSFERWLPLMPESAQLYLNETEIEAFRLLTENEIETQLKELLEKPIANFTIINDVYFRARWAELLKKLYLDDNLKLLEVATGDADMIPQVLARTHPDAHYFTANMNKALNKSLLNKTKDLPLEVEIIEDDAASVENHLGPEVVGIIAFQHAINDVIQAILCERVGVDTIYSDWMETLPKMIKILQQEITQSTLEEHAKGPFLGLISTLLRTLRKDGIIAMNHYMFQLDLDWGYPPELFETMVPMTRGWLQELKGCKEIYIDGFNTNWWIFLQKI